jgi:superfamily II DNA or RNA helicase
MRVPHLVAESLTAVRDPLSQWLRPGPPAPPEAVAAALARALLPAEAPDTPPSWLRPDQHLSFRRSLSAARRFGGALLADGVGTGKSWVALAVVAALEPGRPIHLLVPAALREQWREISRRTGLNTFVHSHETLSRGRAPGTGAGPVLIDESHRFRTAATQRYRTLARWCVGRSGLLVSATPAVNRLSDVAHQVLLLVRDDALAWCGLASLRIALRSHPPGALAHLVITGEDRSGLLPARVTRDLRAEEPSDSPLEGVRQGIEQLRLSRDPAIATLLRVVLLQALASSPPAVVEALGRYRALLLHARDAAAAGRPLSRQVIRRMVGGNADQLVFWQLVAEASPAPELAMEDFDAVARLELAARTWCSGTDAKLELLRGITADRKPSLVFTTATATVHHIRAHFGLRRVAWCTGNASGLDSARVPREAVLDWFRCPALRGDDIAPRPGLLVATDVAAEGLDLPLVERVVHYDLPWTAVRLDQRSGRAVRLGTRHARVEVVRMLPCASLETALRQEAILDSKAGFPVELGLDQGSDAPWRLRARIAAAWAGGPAVEGIACVSGSLPGVVAGFRIATADGTAREVVLARTDSGWTDRPAIIAALLESAHGTTDIRIPDPARVRAVLGGLAPMVRGALRSAHGAQLADAGGSPQIRRVLRRLLAMAQRATRTRDPAALTGLERGMRFLRRGHTAGEAALVATWESLTEPQLLRVLRWVPDDPPPSPPERVELVGVLLVTFPP